MVWGLGGGGLSVAVGGPGHGCGLVGPDGVVDGAVGAGLRSELEAVWDVAAVEVFVFDRPEEALDGSVGPWCPVAGADVGDVSLGGRPGGELRGFEAGAVVGDDPQGPDLSGVGIGEVFDPGDAQEVLHLVQGGAEESDGVSGGLGGGDLAGVDRGIPVISQNRTTAIPACSRRAPSSSTPHTQSPPFPRAATPCAPHPKRC